ncbi:MAG: hypothetical protein PVG39_30080 [Desulfobacteraceae bacterium]|jgi:hypothetical protein
MELSKETEIMCSLTKAPRGWYVLYQTAYNSPNVFNLHEKGLFKFRPRIAVDIGARLLVNEQNDVAIQYMHLVDSNIVNEETGEKYISKLERGLFPLDDDLELDEIKLAEVISEKAIRIEIIRVYNEWISTVSGAMGQEINISDIKKTFSAIAEKGSKFYQEWLIKNNSSWILPFLPRMIHDFRYGIFERVGDDLYNYYKEIGGNNTEEDLLKKINLFSRIYEGEGLSKPEGTLWNDEDEIWDCWIAFTGSEEEAKIVCRTMEKVLVPLKKELKEELGIDT